MQCQKEKYHLHVILFVPVKTCTTYDYFSNIAQVPKQHIRIFNTGRRDKLINISVCILFCFSASRKYALCVYTATALGCSISAADVYFKLLNHTISSIFNMKRYQCALRHPMDEITIYTTSPSTVSASGSAQTTLDNVRGTPRHYKEVSCSMCLQPFCLFQYTLFVYLSSRV